MNHACVMVAPIARLAERDATRAADVEDHEKRIRRLEWSAAKIAAWAGAAAGIAGIIGSIVGPLLRALVAH
jgi:hypothetical protein